MRSVQGGAPAATPAGAARHLPSKGPHCGGAGEANDPFLRLLRKAQQ